MGNVRSKGCRAAEDLLYRVRNLARWCISNVLTVLTVKNLKFYKSKIAAAAILKNRQIAISRPRFYWFWRNLARWRIRPSWLFGQLQRSKEIQDAGGRHPNNLKITISCSTVWTTLWLFIIHLIFLSNRCTSRHQQNRGYGILLLCAQCRHGLVNSAMGRYRVPQNVFLVEKINKIQSYSSGVATRLLSAVAGCGLCTRRCRKYDLVSRCLKRFLCIGNKWNLVRNDY